MSIQHARLIQVPAEQRSNPSHPSPTGTWTIDPSGSSLSFTWRKLRLRTVAGLHCLGVIHLGSWPCAPDGWHPHQYRQEGTGEDHLHNQHAGLSQQPAVATHGAS